MESFFVKLLLLLLFKVKGAEQSANAEKMASTPQPGIEPGPPANAAEALPLSYRGWLSSQPEQLTTSPHHLNNNNNNDNNNILTLTPIHKTTVSWLQITLSRKRLYFGHGLSSGRMRAKAYFRQFIYIIGTERVNWHKHVKFHVSKTLHIIH